MTRRFIVGVLALAMGIAWYMFRPERAFIDRRINEPAPADVAMVLRAGPFVPRVHEGHGMAEILALTGGGRVLRLSDFKTRDGPDLEVDLVGSTELPNRQVLERYGYVSLGPLKGNVGPQNYSIPADVDLGRYRAVAVWCRRFSVNFTSATFTR